MLPIYVPPPGFKLDDKKVAKFLGWFLLAHVVLGIVVFFSILLSGCFNPGPPTIIPQGSFPQGVARFDDGKISCYVYYQHAISCVEAGYR